MFTFLINSKRTDSENKHYIKARAQSPDIVSQKWIRNKQDETNNNIHLIRSSQEYKSVRMHRELENAWFKFWSPHLSTVCFGFKHLFFLCLFEMILISQQLDKRYQSGSFSIYNVLKLFCLNLLFVNLLVWHL